MERFKKFDNFLNEGLRVNTEILNREGHIVDIKEVINDLLTLRNLLDIYDEKNSALGEICDVVSTISQWKKDGWKKIQFFGKEWIPLM